MENKTTQQRVIDDYFAITSSASAAAGAGPRDLAGLRRRLGPWLDVHGKDVLDLGSGLGETCQLCREAGATSVIGVNLSQGEIDLARRYVPATFVCEDIESYLRRSAPDSYDRIFALNILEHLNKDALAHVLEGACRVLRPGGTLVAMVPNATSPFGCMTRYWDITHFNAFTPSSVRQLARLCGFGEAVEFRECGPVAHGPVSAIRYLLWQGLRLIIRFRLLIELASSKGGIYTADMMLRVTKASKPSCG